MAEIKDFNRNQYLLKGGKRKSGSSADTGRDKKSMDNRLARHRQIKLYTVLGILAAIAAVAAITYFRWKSIVYTDYEVIQQNEWIRASDSRSLNLGGTLFTYSNDGMSCTDVRGKMIWNQTYEMQDPVVRTSGRTVAVGDYNGRSIYIADTQGILGTIDTALPIRDLCVSANGIVAAVLGDSTVTSIYLYDTAGEVLVYFKTTMSDSGYPIALDISSDASQVAVSYIKAQDGKIVSSIGFYNFSSVGKNYTDNLVGGYGYPEAVVPLVHFMGNDTTVAVADNRLMFFKGRQKPENVSDIMINEQIQSVFYDEGHIGLVFYDNGAEATYRLEVYDTDAKKVSELAFDLDYKEILFDTSGIIIYNDNELLLYDWDERLKYQGAFQDRVTCFIPGGTIARHTLITDDMIQTIELR